MAIMIPELPKQFHANSQEDLIFNSLRTLPDSFYVFHSFKITGVSNQQVHEGEIDFLIFHPIHGILVIEAKAGQVYYEQGSWFYSSGQPMHGDGPFSQASTNKWKLIQAIKNTGDKHNLLNKITFVHGVWFHSISRGQLLNHSLPLEADKNLTLTKDDLINPLGAIEGLFRLRGTNAKETILNEQEIHFLLTNILSPAFKLIPSITYENETYSQRFHFLLDEQYAILNFLEEQRTAVISGAAGTGKTMIALEKARRHAAKQEKVLFLCYNQYLRNYLQSYYQEPLISFYTIDAFVCKVLDLPKANYSLFKTELEHIYYRDSPFEYQHVIIDEGQDFGQTRMEEENVISLLHSILMDRVQNGTFYIFYDKLQLVQGYSVPEYIREAECKVTLHKNCRNTISIATTSMTTVQATPLLFEGAVTGIAPQLFFYEDKDDLSSQINQVIDEFWSLNIKNIVILSAKTIKDSALPANDEDSYFYKGQRIHFTTTRKFKGLEADAILLVDVDYDTLKNQPRIFYVGASRARFRLSIFANLSDVESSEVAKLIQPSGVSKNPKKALANALKSLLPLSPVK